MQERINVGQHSRARSVTHTFILSQFWTEGSRTRDGKALQLSKFGIQLFIGIKRSMQKELGEVEVRKPVCLKEQCVSRSGE